MDKHIKTSIINDQLKVEVSEDLNFSEALQLSVMQLRVISDTLFQQSLRNFEEATHTKPTEEDEKYLKAHIYDKVVVSISDMLDEFFPEAESLNELSAEELLEKLDKKVAELNALSK